MLQGEFEQLNKEITEELAKIWSSDQPLSEQLIKAEEFVNQSWPGYEKLRPRGWVEGWLDRLWPNPWDPQPGVFEQDGLDEDYLRLMMDNYVKLVEKLKYVNRKPSVFIAGLLEENGVETAVDIGTGPGHLLVVVAEKFPKVKFVGIDPRTDFLTLGLSRFACDFENVEMKLGNGLDPGGFPDADVVFSTNVTHLFNPGELVRFYRVALTKSNWLIVTTDAKRGRLYPLIAPVLGTLIGIHPDFSRDGALTMRKAHSENTLCQAIEWANADSFFDITVETRVLSPVSPIPHLCVVIRKNSRMLTGSLVEEVGYPTHPSTVFLRKLIRIFYRLSTKSTLSSAICK